jgi:hypothetical protein
MYSLLQLKLLSLLISPKLEGTTSHQKIKISWVHKMTKATVAVQESNVNLAIVYLEDSIL